MSSTTTTTVTPESSNVSIVFRKCLNNSGYSSFKSKYKYFVLVLTFFIYASYHLTRKPISVVKSALNPCDGVNSTANCTGGWEPFNGTNSQIYFGALDSAYLFAYAIGMFFCGHIAERSNLRYFLFAGMLASGVTTALFGFGKYLAIHTIWYYGIIQLLAGLVQASGWPPVVTCVANWFGKGNRGFIMGIWNSHTSVGNILGSLLAGAFVNSDWALSFIIPGVEIFVLSVVVLILLIPSPDNLIECTGYSQLPNEQKEDDEQLVADNSEEAPILSQDERSSISVQSDVIIELPGNEVKAVGFFRALRIPGVVEFSLCLFFAKLVSYTFLFWLPYYISKSSHFDASTAALLSTLFDVGGIVGGIAAGFVSDRSKGGALTCSIMLTLAAPMMFLYYYFGNYSLGVNIVLLLIVGFFVNGPYSLITTAVSADLGTHPSLKGNAKALSTVTAIIDGTGSVGAAVGPLLTSFLSKYGWDHVFVMLIISDVIALMLVLRLTFKEVKAMIYTSRLTH